MEIMNRKYSCKDVVMLSACDIMADSALNNIDKVQATNSALTAGYFTGVKDQAKVALKAFFGIDSGRVLKSTTETLESNRIQMLHHLTIIRTQVESNFKDTARVKEILSVLGYKTWWTGAKKNGSQVAMVALLEVFGKGYTDELAAELLAHKISDVSLGYVKENMNRIYELNVLQEGMKTSRKTITRDIVERFNGIYSETMSYSRGLKVAFKNDKILKDAFTFSQVIKTLAPKHKGKPGDADDTTGKR